VMDILELSKLQVGDDILKKEQFNLYEFLSSFQNTFKIQLQQKNLDFKLYVYDSDMDILGDSKYLHRVIYNFIDNAVKFSKENGIITLGAVETKKGLKIFVSDTGIGIDSKDIDDIWDRYYKSAKSGGMGIGLAICGEILKQHNFEYGAVNNEGQGAEFYFIIPQNSYIKKGWRR
ncbi:MAG: sensor histidine kinase, partial [Solirubrobacterales bacterium]